jgi:hypothetical protein
MRKYLIALFILSLTFYFSGNESKVKNIEPDLFAFNIQKNFLTVETLSESSEELFFLPNAEKFATANAPAKKKTSGIPYQFQIGAGIGLIVSGSILLLIFSPALIAGGVVLMTTADRSYTWPNGSYAAWVSPEHFNAGLACTIIGGICFISSIACFIAGGINLGLGVAKKNRSKRASIENFNFIIDYNMDKNNLILGARYAL